MNKKLKLQKEIIIDVFISIFCVVFIMSGFIGGFTKKQRAVNICENQYREEYRNLEYASPPATKGSAWDVYLSKNSDGTYDVSYNKDLATPKGNGIGGYYKNEFFNCDNIKLSPISLPLLSIICIVGLVYYKLKKLNKVPFTNNDYK